MEEGQEPPDYVPVRHAGHNHPAGHPALIEAGTIPNNLVEAAIGAVKGTTQIDRQFVIEQADFVNRIVALSVVEPKLTDADVRTCRSRTAS